MPRLFKIGQYIIFFWSKENDEPIHVHVSLGTISPNTTKIWLTKSGGCIAAHNKSRIPKQNLSKLMDVISSNHNKICEEWKEFFNVDEVKYYC